MSAAGPPQDRALQAASGGSAAASAASVGAQQSRTITLAFTGASGMPYGFRLLECLVSAGARVQVIYSAAAQIVSKQECAFTLPTQPREATRALGERCGARKGQLLVYARDD